MTGRVCGGCTLCCRLVPVEEIGKHAGQKCRHQWHKGCRIHHRPSMFPESCQLWSCMWLTDPAAAALRRPDRTHYVIDPGLDVVREYEPAGAAVLHDVMQVWCDPAFPEAWRDPALLAYIEARGLAAIIRFDQQRARLIVPPALSADGGWIEKPTSLATDIPGSIYNRMRDAGTALPVKPL